MPSIDRLGGGYDYEVWIDHLGIPTIQMVFDYIASGNYHSAYDDLYFMEHWGDPGYLHHTAMAKLAGIAALRLASADVLSFNYSSYAQEISGYLDSLNARQVELYGDVGVSFVRQMTQASAWKAAAANLESKTEALLTTNPFIPEALAGKVAFTNQRLLQQERDLTQAKGLPDRPWFRHMIYAPGIYTGYAVQTLPALQDLISAGEWAKVSNYQALLHNSLTAATNTAATAANAAK